MPEPAGKPLVLWRAIVPRWSWLPLSGEGAALFGGRWNAVGEPAIYAARELSTAWAEYNQGFVQHPALIVQLRLEGARLADLTDAGAMSAVRVPADIHETQWRADLDAGRLPETHRQGARLLEQGFDGVIYPSFMSRGGTCVVLWRWNEAGAPSLKVIDPDNRLPQSPASWQ